MGKDNSKFDPARYRYKSLVIDTSVLSKIFLDEEGADRLKALMKIRMLGEMTIFATPLIVYEFLNVLARAFNDPLKVKKAYERFKEFEIGLIDPGDVFVDSAIRDICGDKSLTYYDASYHALARDVGAVFLTADKKYYDAMKGKGNIVLFK